MTEEQAKRSLSRNRVSIKGNEIGVIPNSLGIGLWGKVDFLCNHCGYIKHFIKQKRR